MIVAPFKEETANSNRIDTETVEYKVQAGFFRKIAKFYLWLKGRCRHNVLRHGEEERRSVGIRKDFVILLLIVVCLLLCGVILYQDSVMAKLNTENIELSVENERLTNLLVRLSEQSRNHWRAGKRIKSNENRFFAKREAILYFISPQFFGKTYRNLLEAPNFLHHIL